METDTTYNGWANYQTWVCKLWLDNDQVTYNKMIALARKAEVEASADKSGAELNELGRLTIDLEMYVESNNPFKGSSMYTDLLNHAIGQIDCREIANAYLEELGE